MTEVFRVREAPQTPEIAPQATLTPQVSDTLKGGETKLTEPLTPEEHKLEIWEGLNNRKFITEYFDIKNVIGEFSLKMQTSVIDKYIKSELENLGYEKNTENYEKILKEIETEIGADRMELFKRISKVTEYIKALNRFKQMKALRDKFLNSTKDD